MREHRVEGGERSALLRHPPRYRRPANAVKIKKKKPLPFGNGLFFGSSVKIWRS